MGEVAKQFGVGLASVNRWVNLFRKTGSVEPLPHAGGPVAKVDELGLNLLCILLSEQPDATRC